MADPDAGSAPNVPLPKLSPAAVVLAVDPGRSKCGLAVVERSAPAASRQAPVTRALRKEVVATEHLLVEVGKLLREFPQVSRVVFGDGTQSATLRRAAAAMFPALEIVVVDEHGSSQRARSRYLIEHPPRGWQRLLPPGLRAPETCYDDTVAQILAEEYLSRQI